jgi:hypothetical protein
MSSQPHLVLLGDSIFDNGAYTAGAPDVVTHLAGIVPAGWRATLCAVDGAMTTGIRGQLRCVPNSATHLVVSVGGNDALRHVSLLGLPVRSTKEAFDAFAPHVDGFRRSYRSALQLVADTRLPVTVCTIYNGRLERDVATAARMALALFNDSITQVALEMRLPVIELRSICTDASDYANPIEPSGSGGLKIAKAILASAHDRIK